jgi:hypothetical protein
VRRGVPVFNAPFSNTRSVAELVLAEIIMLMRGVPQKNAVLHRAGWTKSAARSYEVRGKTPVPSPLLNNRAWICGVRGARVRVQHMDPVKQPAWTPRTRTEQGAAIVPFIDFARR